MTRKRARSVTLEWSAGLEPRRKRPGRRLSASGYSSRMLSFAPSPVHLGNVG
jgi:hypothetical protein